MRSDRSFFKVMNHRKNVDLNLLFSIKKDRRTRRHDNNNCKTVIAPKSFQIFKFRGATNKII